ncbi:unnamed protein product [Lactuca virosa]|uniref:Uncharacterized protein n=1 Tax=Lactuca virosa TaxID=75947 RepID=A0AAU9MUD1_9ASTR|nr:unnamed protein product [Lactuca virosa]
MELRIDDLLVRSAQVVELQKKVEKLKLLRKAEKELAEARIQELLIEIQSLKKMLKKVVLIVLVFGNQVKVVLGDAGCIGLFDGVMVVYGMTILLTI